MVTEANGQQIVITLALNGQLIASLLFGLVMFGLAYNGLVQALGERKEGYTGLLVVGGVLVTLLAVAILAWQIALLMLVAFAASGTPMLIGDIGRHIWRRDQAIQRSKDEIGET